MWRPLYAVVICTATFAFVNNGGPVYSDEEATIKKILGDSVITDECKVKCDQNAKYRTIDGSCNNLKNPCWGMSNRGFSSFLPPQFADGVGCPRLAKIGTDSLPVPRLVSREVHPDKDVKNHVLSQLVLGFGQSIAYEFAAVMNGVKTDTKYSCPAVENSQCKGSVEIPGGDRHLPSPSCTFILPNIHIRCNGTGRICGCTKCKPGQVEYVNGVTTFLDGSSVYGSTQRVLNNLREPNSAKLRHSPDNLLSRSETLKCVNYKPNCSDMCFNTGTELAGNGNFLVLSMFTMWMREHNRLIDRFSSIFKETEILFQEVRKIIGAMMQHVFYHEFLPLMLGDCGHPSLKTPTPKQFLKYDPEIDPTVVSECYVGACRLGHTLLDGNQKLYHSRETWSVGEAKNVELFCPGRNGMKDIIGGMAEQRAMKRDEYVTDVITNKLHFENEPYTDLISIDIIRGRQRGIPGYTDLLKYCGYKVPKDFNGLRKYFPKHIVEKYRELYGENGMDNIDLNSAMLTEKKMKNCNGMWGPVTTCIVSEQFRLLKFGDRFWYENLNEPQSFTQEQIKEIQKTTLARVVCSTVDINKLQKKALEFVRSGNEEVPCTEITQSGDLDISKWK